MTRFTLILNSGESLIKTTNTADFLLPLPGKILSCEAANWDIRLAHLSLVKKSKNVHLPCVLLLSKSLASLQIVGSKFLPVLGVYDWERNQPIVDRALTNLSKNCAGVDVVDLSLTDFNGNLLTADHLNLSVEIVCTLIFEKNC